ncbi:BREX system P-loop protein BrxC [Anaeromyxobacter sp. SG26]|uniref:BREX system P-loop protein BrxC n=1 Tax=Anaeromyxobacter sp. SG26 TaxID=2925407 RepID=UPI001F56299B|nr:BREX system P-loop protein BrxC [Anaeromyxobacter sp. SG26]
MKIRELFRDDVTRPIAPVVYFHEKDPAKVAAELKEYIVTGGFPPDHPGARRVPQGIHEQYVRLLDAMATELERRTGPELPASWISGFYGSGKSSFAKLLGLALEGLVLPDGRSVADALLARDDSPRRGELVDAWARLRKCVPDPMAVVFDIGAEAREGEQIHSAARRQLQKRLDYCPRSDLVADAELRLEIDGAWDEFEAAALKALGRPWREAAREYRAEDHFSHVLHVLDRERYPDPTDWIDSRAGQRTGAGSSVRETVDAMEAMLEQRAEGKSLFIVVDEVSQYVHRDEGRMLALQSFVSELGHRMHGRVWLLATGQQKLEEGGDATTLGKLKDRFPMRLRVHLSSSNIRDVVHKRLLAKSDRGRAELRERFARFRNELKLHAFRLRDGDDLTEEDFVEMYPLLPGHVELLMRITTELRASSRRVQGDDYAVRGLLQLLGELFRQQRLADDDVGRLFTLDAMYDVQESALDPDVHTTMTRIASHAALRDDEMVQRAAKAVALLQLIQGEEKTTAELVGKCLYRVLGEGDRTRAATEALEKLRAENLVSYSEKLGYKLQSSAGQEWQAERENLGAVPEKVTEAVQAKLKELLAEPERPRLRSRPFPWTAFFSDGRHAVDARLQDARDEAAVTVDFRFLRSREERAPAAWLARSDSEELRNRIIWVAADTGAVEDAAREWVRSEKMVKSYRDRRNDLPLEKQRLLIDEESRLGDLDGALKRAVANGFMAGAAYFRGRALSPRDHGAAFATALEDVATKLLPEIFTEFCDAVVSETELAQLLEPQPHGPSGKFLEGGLGILSLDAGAYSFTCAGREPSRILRHIETGNGATGQSLLKDFARPPFGWPADVIRACVVGLLRASKIRLRPEEGAEITSYRDPNARDLLLGSRELRRAEILPARDAAVSPRDRVEICGFFERYLGVALERDNEPIAEAAFLHFPARRERLRQLEQLLSRLPDRPALPPALDKLAAALEACLRSRHVEPTVVAVKKHLDSLRDGLEQLEVYRGELTEASLGELAAAARVRDFELAQLEAAGGIDGLEEDARAVRAQLASERPWRGVAELTPAVTRLRDAYRAQRRAALAAQESEAEAARGRVKTRNGFEKLSQADASAVLRPIGEARFDTTAEAVAPSLAEMAALFPVQLGKAEDRAHHLLDEALARIDEAHVVAFDPRLRGREITNREQLRAVFDELEARIGPQLDKGLRIRIV